MTLWKLSRRVLRRRALERELDAELRDHIERELADGVRAGQSEADVRRQIRLTSGGLDQIKEACRDVRRPRTLPDLGADLRFASRTLTKDRWFAASAILTLALAIGVANTTFIGTYANLMRDLPFERPDRIAIVRTLDGRGREGGVSYPDFEDFRRDARVFDGMAAAFTSGTISLGRDGAVPEQFDGLYPIGRHLELRPARVRTDVVVEESPQPPPPAPVTIIGVSPDIRQGQGDAVPMVYLPFRAEAPAGITLIVRGSGGPARVASAARDAANAIDPDLALGVVRTLDDLRDRSRVFSTGMSSQFAQVGRLALVFSGVGLYSAMAYAVRRRTQEIAIRMALGAQATHVRWLFLRTGTWVVAGGIVLGAPASLAVVRLLQSNVARSDALDAVTLIMIVAVLVTVTLVASIVPAQRATRIEPTTALRIE